MTIECLLDLTGDTISPSSLYEQISFSRKESDIPYLYINMAATIDGKIVIGDIGGTASGVGGKTDQILFRRLQSRCDAAMIGSSTLRAGTVIYPEEISRYVVTAHGKLPMENRFFTDCPSKAWVIAPVSLPDSEKKRIRRKVNLLEAGETAVDIRAALKVMKRDHGVNRLLCEGGGKLNDTLLREGIVDELFLTISPKLKGGSNLPTTVGGTGFPPGQYLNAYLVSVYRDESELYLRYRLGASLDTG